MPRSANTRIYLKRRFIKWLATPDYDRTPNTQKALAEELGVDAATLSDWKTPALLAEVNELVDRSLSDTYPQAVSALKRETVKGSFPHMKMYFEMIGKYVQRTNVNLSGAVGNYSIEIGSEGDNSPGSPTDPAQNATP